MTIYSLVGLLIRNRLRELFVFLNNNQFYFKNYEPLFYTTDSEKVLLFSRDEKRYDMIKFIKTIPNV